MNNSVIIATKAILLADTLSNMLKEINLKVYVVNNENDLYSTINNTFPRLIFIEHCFRGFDTDNYIAKTMKYNSNLHIVIWSAADLLPCEAARFFYAGAESFFSLREKIEDIECIISGICNGRRYCPKDVQEELHKDTRDHVFNCGMTDREIQITKLFGYEDDAIAGKLSLELTTVYHHKKNIFRKCGKKRKNEVLVYVLKNKIITVDELG